MPQNAKREDVIEALAGMIRDIPVAMLTTTGLGRLRSRGQALVERVDGRQGTGRRGRLGDGGRSWLRHDLRPPARPRPSAAPRRRAASAGSRRSPAS